MTRVFRDAGFQLSREFDEGVLHLEFDVDPTERSLEVRDAREQCAEARSVHNVLHPRSVAVIGASTDPRKIGHGVLLHLLRGNFAGPVYPVNPGARSVRGVHAYAAVTEIPDDVDLAVVAVPAAVVSEVMDSCLAKGVKALVVLSGGFADAGPGGVSAQRRLVEEARAHGMRVVGPNALGVANTDPQVRLNATLAPALPPAGRVGFFSQSGALSVTLLAAAAGRGLGLSTFVSAGNRADLSGNDVLQYWQTDPATDVVLLYMESFGNPRKFTRLARRLARTKPIVAVKSGRWATTPTTLASTVAPVDESRVQALFEHSGVIRVQNVPQMFDVAQLLAYQPLPAGGRVAVVGNSTTLNLLVVDELHGEDLVLAGDPVDAGATVSPEGLAAAVGAAGRSDDVDALVVVFVPPLAMSGTAHAEALREAVAGLGKPVVTTFLGTQGMLGELAVLDRELAVLDRDGVPVRGSVPSYPTPERAVDALRRAVRYARWRTAPPGETVRPPRIDVQDARALVDRHEGEREHVLDDEERVALLRYYGIKMLPFRRVGSAGEAVAAASELGFPVAIKATAEQWQHRVDGAGVRLMIVTPQGARQAFADLSRDLRARRGVRAGDGSGHLLRRRAARRPVVRLAAVVRALRDGQRAARRPGLPAGSAVHGRRRRADPRTPGGPAAVGLPRRAACPAGRAGGPGATAQPAGPGPARGPVAGARPRARRTRRGRRVGGAHRGRGAADTRGRGPPPAAVTAAGETRPGTECDRSALYGAPVSPAEAHVQGRRGGLGEEVLPLSSITTNAGKSSTSTFQTASIPSSGYSITRGCRRCCWRGR